MPKLARVSWVVAGLVGIASIGATVLLTTGPALATPSLQTALVAKYPSIRDTQLDSCVTCHMPAIEGFLNKYGLDLKEAKMHFEEIEGLDSDGDGTSNIDEIKEEAFPGSQATFPEYYVFHVDFSDEDPELGKVHFNHEMHVIKESYISQGRCTNCHGKNRFPKVFDDNKPVRHLAHQICWRCHETSGSKLAPRDCTGCHTGIKDILDDIKHLLD